MKKQNNVPVVRISLDTVKGVLKDAYAFGKALDEQLFHDAVIFVHRGALQPSVVADTLTKLGHYRKDHPLRRGLNFAEAKSGLRYLLDGKVSIGCVPGDKPISGDYRVQVFA